MAAASSLSAAPAQTRNSPVAQVTKSPMGADEVVHGGADEEDDSDAGDTAAFCLCCLPPCLFLPPLEPRWPETPATVRAAGC